MKQVLILAVLVARMASCGSNSDGSHDTGVGQKDSTSATKTDPTVTGTDNGAIVNPNNISDTAGSRAGTTDSAHSGHAGKKDSSKKQKQ